MTATWWCGGRQRGSDVSYLKMPTMNTAFFNNAEVGLFRNPRPKIDEWNTMSLVEVIPEYSVVENGTQETPLFKITKIIQHPIRPWIKVEGVFFNDDRLPRYEG